MTDGSSQRQDHSIIMPEHRQKATVTVQTTKMTEQPPSLASLVADAALPITVLTLLHFSSFRSKIVSLRTPLFPEEMKLRSKPCFLEPSSSKASNTNLNPKISPSWYRLMPHNIPCYGFSLTERSAVQLQTWSLAGRQ